LPEDYIAAHAPNEDGKIVVSTQYPDVFPFFEYAESDELRKKMVLIYSNRAYPQNEEVLRNLVVARHELAQLAGFNNYAELVTADKMSGSPERVAEFLHDLKGYTADTQDAEYEILLARLREDKPDAERLESWQNSYIRSKVRREQYDVDTKVIREYFNYDGSRDGILTLVQDLFSVRIEPWETETWHEDVEAYELFDGDEAIGRFYLDMHPREGKYQHAAMFPFVVGIEGQQLPVAGLICNFPSGAEPMQHSQVVTFLHEFGHLIHWMFAGHQEWSNISGIATEWDFVEAPSQMLQEWVWDYDTISVFAKNADGDVLPRDLHERMVAARDFGLGMGTRGQLQYAGTSLGLYSRDPADIDFDDLVSEMRRTYTRFEPLEGSHGWAAFGHLNGYSAIYYTYQWSLAIGTDMFTRFKEGGLRNVEIAKAYRDKVLAPGGSRPAEELVTDFLGRPISFETYADRLRGTAKKLGDDN
jgi:thimet oligopeptidase